MTLYSLANLSASSLLYSLKNQLWTASSCDVIVLYSLCWPTKLAFMDMQAMMLRSPSPHCILYSVYSILHEIVYIDCYFLFFEIKFVTTDKS